MGKATRKYYRTIILGVAAMAALVWSAVDQFGIPWEDMLELLWTTVVVTATVIVAAGLGAALWMGLRRLLRRDED